MDRILKKLDNFFDSEDHVLLIKGKWGVGKTFIVNDWVQKKSKDQKIKSIYLSLFGVKTTQELYNQLIEKTDSINKIKTMLKKTKNYIPYSEGFLIRILFSLLDNKKYKEDENHIIIIDDVERKDNELSIEEMFGFIDNLKIKKSKVILIVNEEWLNTQNNCAFNRFKEKVVDNEILIRNPSKNVKEAICNDVEILNKCDLINVDNLRTIMKLKKIVKNYEINDEIIVNALLLSLECIDNNKYSREEYINKIIQEKTMFKDISNSDVDDKKIEEDIRNKCSKEKLSDKEIFIEMNYKNDIFKNVQEYSIKKLLSLLYDCTQANDYEILANFKIEYKVNDFKYAIKGEELFYSSNPHSLINDFLHKINDEYINNKNNNLLPLFKELIRFKYISKPYLDKNCENLDFYFEIEKNIFNDISISIMTYNCPMDDYFDSFYYPFFNEKYEDKFIEIKKEIAEKLEDEFINYYLNNNYKNIYIKYSEIKKHFSSFDLTNQKDKFLLLIDRIIYDISEYFLNDINKEKWNEARNSFVWFNYFDSIICDIVKIVDKYIEKGNENQKSKLLILKNKLKSKEICI